MKNETDITDQNVINYYYSEGYNFLIYCPKKMQIKDATKGIDEATRLVGRGAREEGCMIFKIEICVNVIQR
jgi:hypothetical protein